MRKRKIWDFSGGIHLPETKNKSKNTKIKTLPLPSKFIVPLNHNNFDGYKNLIVSKNQYVLRGQVLTISKNGSLPIHAPTSGTISSIEPYEITHPFKKKNMSIILIADGKDTWEHRYPITNYYNYSEEILLNRIHQSGISGLGGAGFFTKEKLLSCKNFRNMTFIINAAECETYVTADDLLIQEHIQDIMIGIKIICYLLKPKNIFFAIEDNKVEAIKIIKSFLNKQNNSICEIRIIPTKYPSGSSRQLVKILTGNEIPYWISLNSIGILILNVSTIYAIKKAIYNGEPLIERIITVTGNALSRPGNVLVRFGTTIDYLLKHFGFIPLKNSSVIVGGILMGFSSNSLKAPITKNHNCFIVPSSTEISKNLQEKECIRCNYCSDVCPIRLLPQHLYLLGKNKQYEKMKDYNIFDCIECGACSYVCPSNIPLVDYYRQQKKEIYMFEEKKKYAEQIQIQFKTKINRINTEEKKRLFSQKLFSYIKDTKFNNQENFLSNIEENFSENQYVNFTKKLIERAKKRKNLKCLKIISYKDQNDT